MLLLELVKEIDDILYELYHKETFNHKKMSNIGFKMMKDFDKWFEERIKFYKK